MSQPLRLVLLKQIAEDPELQQQWNALVERADRPQVFYTYEWAVAVQRAYHATLRPLIFLSYDGKNSLCGVAALAANVEGDEASFLCATTGDYCEFVSLPDHKLPFITAVLGELKNLGVGKITLTNLPADSDTVAALRRASAQSGFRYFGRTAYICAQVALAKLERPPGQNKPTLPGKKMVRRSLKEMSRNAPVRLDHSRTWEAIKPILPQFVQSHVARFLATGRISNLVQPERRIFLEELAQLLSNCEWIALTRLMSGDDVFAWNYGFQFRGTWFWYQPTFDSDLEKLSPGFCLLAKLIEDAAETSGVDTVDLGLGAEEYKDRFANQSRTTLHVTLTASTMQHAREVLRYRAAQVLKSQPKLEAASRAAVGRLKELRQVASRDGLAGAMRQLIVRAAALLASKKTILLLEWCGPSVPHAGAARLEPLDLNRAAVAADLYSDDESTLEFLLRCAARLRKKTGEGFAFSSSEGSFLCLTWVASFDGSFRQELGASADAPAVDAVILIDSWTPAARRGHGYYEQTVGLLAKELREKGKTLWVLCAESDILTLREVENAGFQKRFSFTLRRVLGWQSVKGKTPFSLAALATEVATRVS